MKTRTLVIIFNRYYPKNGTSYVEVVHDSGSMSSEERDLKHRPRAARFDAVLETGDGEYNQWNAHRARRLYGHVLQKS